MQDTDNVDPTLHGAVENEPVFEAGNRPLPEHAADPAGESAKAAKARPGSNQAGGSLHLKEKPLRGFDAGFTAEVVEMVEQVAAGGGPDPDSRIRGRFGPPSRCPGRKIRRRGRDVDYAPRPVSSRPARRRES